MIKATKLIQKVFRHMDTVVVLVMICFCFIAVFVFNKTVVEGISMENSYKDKDTLITSLLYSSISRGDVVVFFSDNKNSGTFVNNMFSILWETKHKNPQVRDIYIKRIIGIPGDIVEMQNKKILINSNEIPEPYAKNDWNCGLTQLSTTSTSFKSLIVPENSYFVMGDNRGCSTDSRVLGSINKQAILGKVILKF
jgi:signal peptidase I